ncbi:hypothetical protein AVEN_95044-1, partial [Araneus ventricosus]
MRNAAPTVESEALVTSTRTQNSQIFEALPPQFFVPRAVASSGVSAFP